MKVLTKTSEGKIKVSLSSWLVVIIISLAVAPAFALGEGNRNLLLIGVMAISPLIVLKFHKLYKEDIWLYLFMLSIVVIPPLVHPESLRWSTIFYSLMFAMTFIAYKQLLHRNKFTPKQYLQLLKYLIYAYFIVLLIQQFCVLTGLPIFNISNYTPSEPWKLNSLAAEPSHSGRIVALLMYCYIVMKEVITNKKYNFSSNIREDKWIWIAFLWTMLTMGSATAILFIGIVLMKFMRFKNILSLLILFLMILFIIDYVGIHAFERTIKFVSAVATLDINKIIETDQSAAQRVVPLILIPKLIDMHSINGWFGYGIDYVSTFLYKYIPGIPEGSAGGGLFQVWMEYGFITFVLFALFSFFTVNDKSNYLNIVFWFLLVVMNGVNSQISWLTIALLYSIKYFNSKREK